MPTVIPASYSVTRKPLRSGLTTSDTKRQQDMEDTDMAKPIVILPMTSAKNELMSRTRLAVRIMTLLMRMEFLEP